jgi:hypothetical protein
MDTTLDAPSDPRVKAIILGLRGLINAAQAHGSAEEIAAWRATFVEGFERALRAREFDDQPAASTPPAPAPRWVVPLTALGVVGALIGGGGATASCFSELSGCDGGLCALCLGPLMLGIAIAVILGVTGVLIRSAMSRTLKKSLDALNQPQWPLTAEGRVMAVHRLLSGTSAELVAAQCGVAPVSVRTWWSVALDEGTRAVKARP